MRKLIWLFLAFAASCTSNNSDDSYTLNGNPISFIMDLQTIKVSFLTSTPGKTIELSFNKNVDSRLATWNDVMGFLRKDNSYLGHYIPDDHDCKQFANELFLNAQRDHYKAYFVILAIKGEKVGHAITAIDTSDVGRVYIDFTPMMANDKERPSRRIVWVKEGDPYIRVPLENLDAGFANRQQDFMVQHAKQTTTALALVQYNKDFDRLDVVKKDIEKRIENLNSGIARGEGARLIPEQDQINRDVTSLNAQMDSLQAQEEHLRSTNYDFDFTGKDWIIQSVKTIP